MPSLRFRPFVPAPRPPPTLPSLALCVRQGLAALGEINQLLIAALNSVVNDIRTAGSQLDGLPLPTDCGDSIPSRLVVQVERVHNTILGLPNLERIPTSKAAGLIDTSQQLHNLCQQQKHHLTTMQDAISHCKNHTDKPGHQSAARRARVTSFHDLDDPDDVADLDCDPVEERRNVATATKQLITVGSNIQSLLAELLVIIDFVPSAISNDGGQTDSAMVLTMKARARTSAVLGLARARAVVELNDSQDTDTLTHTDIFGCPNADDDDQDAEKHRLGEREKEEEEKRAQGEGGDGTWADEINPATSQMRIDSLVSSSPLRRYCGVGSSPPRTRAWSKALSTVPRFMSTTKSKNLAAAEAKSHGLAISRAMKQVRQPRRAWAWVWIGRP